MRKIHNWHCVCHSERSFRIGSLIYRTNTSFVLSRDKWGAIYWIIIATGDASVSVLSSVHVIFDMTFYAQLHLRVFGSDSCPTNKWQAEFCETNKYTCCSDVRKSISHSLMPLPTNWTLKTTWSNLSKHPGLRLYLNQFSLVLASIHGIYPCTDAGFWCLCTPTSDVESTSQFQNICNTLISVTRCLRVGFSWIRFLFLTPLIFINEACTAIPAKGRRSLQLQVRE